MSIMRNPFHQPVLLEIGGLTVETSMEQISIRGDLDLRRDRIGLERARYLRDLLDGVVLVLEREGGDLLDEVPAVSSPRGANPVS